MSIPAHSDIVRSGVSAFAIGGGGGATITRVEVDFGSSGRVSSKTFDVTVPGVTSGQMIVASASLDMPAGVAEDELEMDPISVAAHGVAADTVRLIVSSHSTLRGKRAINVLR